MSNADAAEILKICLALTWKGKLSGYMLAGWIVTAMIAGAMRWRSHIVVTGEPGAGKSWVMDYILKVIMGKIALIRSGGSTEAKIRKDIGSTARPVIMDEAESETQKDRSNMELVYGLARKSSSGADLANFNGVFPVKSSFCFAAINPRIIQGADLDQDLVGSRLRNRPFAEVQHLGPTELPADHGPHREGTTCTAARTVGCVPSGVVPRACPARPPTAAGALPHPGARCALRAARIRRRHAGAPLAGRADSAGQGAVPQR